MGIEIAQTFDYGGEVYGIRQNKVGGWVIFVYAPTGSDTKYAWKQVHDLGGTTTPLEDAKRWVENQL